MMRVPTMPTPMSRPDDIYMVVDLEALVIAPQMYVIEQAAYVVVDANCNEVSSGRFCVKQTEDSAALVRKFGLPSAEPVETAIDNYVACTGDPHYVHDDDESVSWSWARGFISELSRRFVATTYAKGISLEQKAFGHRITFVDLAWYGCPKYQRPLHDPLDECRFFARYIPQLKSPDAARVATKGPRQARASINGPATSTTAPTVTVTLAANPKATASSTSPSTSSSTPSSSASSSSSSSITSPVIAYTTTKTTTTAAASATNTRPNNTGSNNVGQNNAEQNRRDRNDESKTSRLVQFVASCVEDSKVPRFRRPDGAVGL